jgi:hypothetical protein
MFKDPNLQLAVLEAAWDAKLLPPFDKDAFYRGVLGETWDANRDGEEVDERTREALLGIALPPEILESIEVMEWGGGEDAQSHILHFWDGEDETFDVTDLDGIGACRSIRDLDLGASHVTDIGPLADLKKLESLELAYSGFSGIVTPGVGVKFFDRRAEDLIGDLTPLLELTALRELRVDYLDDERNRAVIAALKKRGVNVETREEAGARMLADADAGARKGAIEEGMLAFQQKRYADVIAALDRYASFLDGSTRLKLEFARKQVAKT